MIYYTSGVCSKEINIELDGDIIKEVDFKAGCPGNLIGISQLVKGMKVQGSNNKIKRNKMWGQKYFMSRPISSRFRNHDIIIIIILNEKTSYKAGFFFIY